MTLVLAKEVCLSTDDGEMRRGGRLDVEEVGLCLRGTQLGLPAVLLSLEGCLARRLPSEDLRQFLPLHHLRIALKHRGTSQGWQ